MNPQATVICGPQGLRQAHRNHDIIVIVDVLRFSSAVTTAIANRFEIIPAAPLEAARRMAEEGGLALAGSTGQARYSLSPIDYLNPSEPETVVLFSPNAAHCAAQVDGGPAFIGCFLNARAVARITERMSREEGRNIVLMAAGERLEEEHGRRFAIEDYLACGMILSESGMDMTAEAEMCQRCYEACKMDFAELVKGGQSGQSITARGLAFDLSHCLQRNIYEVVPLLAGGRIVRHQPDLYA